MKSYPHWKDLQETQLETSAVISTCVSSTLDDPVTLTFDLLTSRSMHAKFLTYTHPFRPLIAQATFLLERGYTQTHKVTNATDHPTHVSAAAGGGGNHATNYTHVHPMKTCTSDVQTDEEVVTSPHH